MCQMRCQQKLELKSKEKISPNKIGSKIELTKYGS